MSPLADGPVLVLRATGKSGRRVVERLRAQGPVGDGVRQALGRAPRDVADYARVVAATGAWRP